MLAPPSKPLRSALLSVKLQPTLLSPCTATSISAPTQRRFHSQSANHITTLPRSSHRPTPFHTIPASTPTSCLRSITSSASSSPSPTSPTTTTLSPTSSPPSTPLTWNAYLTLRRTRRRYNLFSSVITSLCTTTAGISYLAQQSLENVGVFGLDPFVVLGLATLGSGGVGWLVGPTLGNAVFGVRYRRLAGEIDAKEKDLFRRIKQHRVDPSGASSSNPVPDYYGEKIDSVRGYRNWMKDQRAFNKKRQNFL